MDIEAGIKHILDGNAVIIMGSGASYGAKNASGEFPSGAVLAKSLYAKLNVTPEDEYDLQDAAQLYEEQNSASELIREIRSCLNCVSFQPYHVSIYGKPWMRYYTTNYDNVALLAAREAGTEITPVTLSAHLKNYREKQHLCVHINGHIDRLDEKTLHSEFKLTAGSYLSGEYITNSEWGALLSDDLEAAKCIVIVGLSLRYDLDLGRLLYSPEIKEKTIIIDRPDLPENAYNKLARFGSVYAIGISDFADEINKIAATYTPQNRNPLTEAYTCFEHEYHRPCSFEEATPADVFSLFFSGTYRDKLFHTKNGKYTAFIERTQSQKIKEALMSGKSYIFIHSNMGNGKTACIHELRAWLSQRDYHVFSLANTNLARLSLEISSICSIDSPCVVIIENYLSYMDVLHIFSRQNHSNIQFIFTARSSVNFSRMPDVLDLFAVSENESAVIAVDKLSSDDINRCVAIFDRYGAWGRLVKLPFDMKRRRLTARNHGNREFQSIMLDVLDSEEMAERVKAIVSAIENESQGYHDALILVLITQAMNLRISVTDIEKMLSLSIITDARFRMNVAVQELLSFTDMHKGFAIHSPVTSSYILQKIAKPDIIVNSLYNLAQYAIKYCHLPRYSTLLNEIISFSHISTLMPKRQNPSGFLASYYDKLGMLEYYRTSNFFWLQYAISCIEIKDFLRAQKYLNNAYGLAPKDFVPFQINNQQARLYLEQIIANESTNPFDNFQEAHRILMLPIVSEKDNEYNVVKLFGYYTRKEFRSRMVTPELQEFYRQACKDAYNRLSVFMNKNPTYRANFQDLSQKLLKGSFDT